MKILILMRHAKSLWSDEYPEDFARPLNKRGLRDAPRMGELLAQHVLTPDCILASAARRAADTAAAVASASGFEGALQITRELYHAPAETYVNLAARQPASVQRILMIGHNPGISEAVRRLSGDSYEMATAAMAQFALDLEKWSALKDGCPCQLVSFWRPSDLD